MQYLITSSSYTNNLITKTTTNFINFLIIIIIHLAQLHFPNFLTGFYQKFYCLALFLNESSQGLAERKHVNYPRKCLKSYLYCRDQLHLMFIVISCYDLKSFVFVNLEHYVLWHLWLSIFVFFT